MNSKITLSLLALCLCTAAATKARTLTPAEALSRAGVTTHALGLNSSAETPRLVFTAAPQDSDEPALYVFNRGSADRQAGYLVTGADDEFSPAVLGFADQGSFDPANVPPQLQWWLQEYARQIEWVRQHQSSAPGLRRTVSIADDRTWSSIPPLCQTRWNQDAPYWNLCPVYTPISGDYEGQSLQCVTGCVATAMSQAIKYHNWPVRGLGTKSGQYTIEYPTSSSSSVTS